MNIGNKIKTLRNKKALSQSELADILHVTAQAVSKWESNLSYPDINQLPTLASLFGITIDELFEYPSDLEYERIDHMIENGKALSNEFFDHSEEFLLNEIKNDPKNYRAISTLADLYHFHACRLNDKAVHYASVALQLKPDNKFDLNTLNNSSNGYINDWNIGCHYKLIEQLTKMVKDNSNNSRTKLYLLDNLIADCRLDEATSILDESHLELDPFYRVWIEEVKYGFGVVEKNYEQLMNDYADDWKILMEVANRYAFNRKYDEAIDIYERTFEKAQKPRYTDMLACIAYLYRSIGNSQKAIETYQRELLLLKEEWNTTKGELVEEIKQNIEQLKNNQ